MSLQGHREGTRGERPRAWFFDGRRPSCLPTAQARPHGPGADRQLGHALNARRDLTRARVRQALETTADEHADVSWPWHPVGEGGPQVDECEEQSKGGEGKRWQVGRCAPADGAPPRPWQLDAGLRAEGQLRGTGGGPSARLGRAVWRRGPSGRWHGVCLKLCPFPRLHGVE